MLRSGLGEVLDVCKVLSREGLRSPLLNLCLFDRESPGLEVLDETFLFLDLVSLLA